VARHRPARVVYDSSWYRCRRPVFLLPAAAIERWSLPFSPTQQSLRADHNILDFLTVSVAADPFVSPPPAAAGGKIDRDCPRRCDSPACLAAAAAVDRVVSLRRR